MGIIITGLRDVRELTPEEAAEYDAAIAEAEATGNVIGGFQGEVIPRKQALELVDYFASFKGGMPFLAHWAKWPDVYEVVAWAYDADGELVDAIQDEYVDRATMRAIVAKYPDVELKELD
jgi:hypothetical protein